ncbi:MAG TPA: minor capsid protein, partial [Candidatus Hodarchaeales archaeon]|nr:minor capsid protein [Candidatus Hodarchaeales archaeon]
RIIEGKKIDKVNDLKLKFLKDMEMAWRAILRDVFAAGGKSAQAEVKEARQEVKMQELDTVQLFEDSINQRGFFITGVERDRILKEARMIILSGIDRGYSVKETIKQLDELFLDDYDFDSGRLETIVRTNVNKAFNFGRRTIFEDPELEGYVVAYAYSSIIDSRTTPVCEALDGHVWRVGDEYLDLVQPPRHFQCRSLLIPIVQGEDYEVSKEVVKRDDLESFTGLIS